MDSKLSKKSSFLIFWFILILISLASCESYDAIIVGSGIGGLATAVQLSVKYNYKILILEKFIGIGGSLQTYYVPSAITGKDYEITPGLHYLSKDENIDIVAGQKVIYNEMDKIYDLVMMDEEVYKISKPVEFEKMLKASFPNESEAISKYFREMIFPILPKKKMSTFIDSLTNNDALKLLFSYNLIDLGLLQYETPLFLYSFIMMYFANGPIYPQGGAKVIVEGALDQIVQNGGKYELNCEVYELLLNENEKVRGVTSKCGEFTSDIVISDMGVKNTFNKKFIDENVLEKYDYISKVKKINNTYALMMFEFCFLKSSHDLGFLKKNIWYFKNSNSYKQIQSDYFTQKVPFEKYEDILFAYITSSSAKDESYIHGLSHMTMIVPVNYEWFNQWENSTTRTRPKEYYILKDKYRTKAKQLIFKLFPITIDYVDAIIVSTPLTFKDILSHDKGSAYGIKFDFDNFEWIQSKTEIEGLWLTGQDVMVAGVSGVIQTGLSTADEIAKHGEN